MEGKWICIGDHVSCNRYFLGAVKIQSLPSGEIPANLRYYAVDRGHNVPPATRREAHGTKHKTTSVYLLNLPSWLFADEMFNHRMARLANLH